MAKILYLFGGSGNGSSFKFRDISLSNAFRVIPILLFVGSIIATIYFCYKNASSYNKEIESEYGVRVYSPEVIVGEFIDAKCIRDLGHWGDAPKVSVDLLGVNGQKTILPISGTECPAVSIAGEGRLTTIIYEKCGHECRKSIAKSIID
jgi:hypothetical protein